eukprot:TRINITY_DN27979_c0_g1_i2.p1 TRINITY_DN27979_c0_g1~~TRINITY_DN27979_c0_g1_i2.p1  ORF type:complete len:234 (-),score=17.42 TRINITY_DN27979_c0_g1_i2:159-860(-)
MTFGSSPSKDSHDETLVLVLPADWLLRAAGVASALCCIGTIVVAVLAGQRSFWPPVQVSKYGARPPAAYVLRLGSACGGLLAAQAGRALRSRFWGSDLLVASGFSFCGAGNVSFAENRPLHLLFALSAFAFMALWQATVALQTVQRRLVIVAACSWICLFATAALAATGGDKRLRETLTSLAEWIGTLCITVFMLSLSRSLQRQHGYRPVSTADGMCIGKDSDHTIEIDSPQV